MDLTTIRQAQQGIEEAVNEIYESMYKRVYYFALKMVGSENDAEDVVQETFISAFKALPNLEKIESFQSWLFQITANKSRNLLRKNKKVETVDASGDDETNEEFIEKQPDREENLIPEDALDNEAKKKIILGIINSLPDNQKECVMMFYYSEMGVKEIAETLGVSEGTVKSRLNYARQKIKDGILETEKTQDIRLHALIPLGLFLFKDFESITASLSIPALAGGAAGMAAGSAGAAAATAETATVTGTAAAAEAAAGTATATGAAAAAGGISVSAAAVGGAVKTGLLATLKGKIIAGVVAGLLAVGGVAAAVTVVPDMIDSSGGGFGSGIHQDKDAGNKQEEKDPFAFEVDKLTPEVATAYWKLLNERINEHGISTTDSDFDGVKGGFLLDMDNDGVPELILVSPEEVYGEGVDWPTFSAYTYRNGVTQVYYNMLHWTAPDLEYTKSSLVKTENGIFIEERHKWTETDEETYYIDINDEEALTEETINESMITARQEVVVIGANVDEKVLFENNAKQLLSALKSRAALNAETFLESIEYYGDRSKCVMPKEMAEVYAEVLEGLPNTYKSDPMNMTYNLTAYLADPNDDGMPILMTFYVNTNSNPYDNEGYLGGMSYYGFDNGKAVKYEFDSKYEDPSCFFDYNGKAAFVCGSYPHGEDQGFLLEENVYVIENAVIKKDLDRRIYRLDLTYEGDIEGPLPVDVDYTIDDCNRNESILENDGWIKEVEVNVSPGDGHVYENIAWYKAYDNGKDITTKYNNTMTDDFYEQFSLKNIGIVPTDSFASIWDGGSFVEVVTTPASDAIQYLREYAKVAGRPSYDYPEVSGTLSSEELAKIAEVVAKELKGEVGEIFKISDDLYYVIIYVDDEPVGGVTIKSSINEESGYRVISSGSELCTDEDLSAAVQEDESVSNITLNYSEAGKNKADYLEKAMTQIDGTTVNDAAKGQIVSYVQTAVTEESAVNVKCSKNSATIDGGDIKKSLEKAADAHAEMSEVLDGVTLNKSVTVVLRVVCKNMNAGETAQVTFDPSILDSIGEADEIQVILGDPQYGVSISTSALQNLCSQYGKVIVQVQKVGDATYDIVFVDAEGNKIDQISESLAFTLPAPDEMATVFATYSGGSDNWGGQFDGANRTIEFSTPYSGKYGIIDNAADIKDIAELDQQTSDAIKFMVSKGYFAVDESGNFNPDETLNRYMFVEALVRMFFTTDHTLTTSFTDVPEDSPYYTYVASGEKDNIVEGISENKFGGNQEVTREQIIALCARTLADKKGYTYPENPDEYLTFTDADRIGGWARSTTALAVREGLIDRGGELAPKEAVSRDEAALMLYKLFMLLYETSAENVSVSTNVGGGDFPVVPVVGGAIVLLAAAGGGVFFMKKKKGAAAVAEEPAEAEIAEEPALEETETEAETSEGGDDEEVVEIVKREVENAEK